MHGGRRQSDPDFSPWMRQPVPPIRRVPAKTYIEHYLKMVGNRSKEKPAPKKSAARTRPKPAAGKSAAKKPAAARKAR